MIYYTVFLTSGIMLAQEGYFYDITIDDCEFRPEAGYDSHALGTFVEGRYLNRCKNLRSREHRHSELKAWNDENSNILQMADVLTGAVAFCHNGGQGRTSRRSAGMKELVEVIRQSYGGLPMNRPQTRGSFGIWWFHSNRGRRRAYPLFPKSEFLDE
jgi:hypothetical protein